MTKEGLCVNHGGRVYAAFISILIKNDRAKRFSKSAIPPGPLPARWLIGRRIGPYGPSGPEAKIRNLKFSKKLEFS